MSNLRDLKDALSNARKADTTHVRRAFQIYTARPCEFGNVKYERGNYRRPLGDGTHVEPTRADFERFRGYLRAARDHIDETLDAMELHLATDPQLLDVEGMKRAAYAEDLDVSPGSEWLGPSRLPHIAPACASLNMAITQATDCGLLPKDPGVTWDAKAVKPTSSTTASPRSTWRGMTFTKASIGVGDRVRVALGMWQGRHGVVVEGRQENWFDVRTDDDGTVRRCEYGSLERVEAFDPKLGCLPSKYRRAVPALDTAPGIPPYPTPEQLDAEVAVLAPRHAAIIEEAADRARQAAVDSAPSLCVKR